MYSFHSPLKFTIYYNNCFIFYFQSQNRIAIGTYNGEIKVFNLFTSQEELSFAAHESFVANLECSNNEKLLISSTSWRTPLTTLWGITNETITQK